MTYGTWLSPAAGPQRRASGVRNTNLSSLPLMFSSSSERGPRHEPMDRRTHADQELDADRRDQQPPRRPRRRKEREQHEGRGPQRHAEELREAEQTEHRNEGIAERLVDHERHEYREQAHACESERGEGDRLPQLPVAAQEP